MNIQITDLKYGKVVALIPITLRGLNFQFTQQQLFDEAWESAVEDSLVDVKRKSDYRFLAIG